MSALSRAIRRGIRAFHGSPHDFDRFDLSRIGTGEGAQAYGHGLYFAENEGVARSYRLSNAGRFADAEKYPPQLTANTYAEMYPTREEAVAELDRLITARTNSGGAFLDSLPELRQAREILATGRANPGRMYEVNINAAPEEFIDYDRPLSEQPAALARMRSAGVEVRPGEEYLPAEYWINGTGPEQSQRLRAAGVPGIRYLDQGSRAAGEGSRNYVVFDDSLIEILRKYGLAGLATGGGSGLLALANRQYSPAAA